MGAAAKIVRIASIDAHPHNVRADLGDLRPLAASIKRLGILTPVTLEVRGSRYRIRDGHRRVLAAKLANRNTVPAIVHSEALSDDEWITQAAATASHRNALTRQDQARCVLALRELGYTWADVADALNVSESVCRELSRNSTPARKAPRAWMPPTTVSLKRLEEALAEGEAGVRALLTELRTPPDDAVAA